MKAVKKEILFIHSAGPQGLHNGSDFLLTHLIENLSDTYLIHHPLMPNPENPHYDAWRMTLKEVLDERSNTTILVGHSLGGSTLLKYLSESGYKKTIDGLFLIAAPYWGATDWLADEYVLHDNFSSNLPEIGRVFLYHSEDDEVVPVEHLNYYAAHLPFATIRTCARGGHLFSHGLPELVDDIKNLL